MDCPGGLGLLPPWLGLCLPEAGVLPVGSPAASTERREQSSRPLRGQPTLPTPALGAARKPWRARGTQARPVLRWGLPAGLFFGTWSPACRGCVPLSVPRVPCLSLILSPCLLPASSRRARPRCLSPGGSCRPGPETPRALSPRHRALGSPPPHWLRPGAGVTALARPRAPRFLAPAKEAPGGDGLGASLVPLPTPWAERWPGESAAAGGRPAGWPYGELGVLRGAGPGPAAAPSPRGAPGPRAVWEY